MGDEIDRVLRILSAMRECIEADLNHGLNLKEPGIPKGTLTQLKEISSIFNSLCDAKVRLDKTAKQLAESMSAEEELAAVRAYIRALEPRQRQKFLEEEQAWSALNF